MSARTPEERLSAIERRMDMLVRAHRMEWHGSPVGEFEKVWNAIDPENPAPEPYNPLDGTRLWDNS